MLRKGGTSNIRSRSKIQERGGFDFNQASLIPGFINQIVLLNLSVICMYYYPKLTCHKLCLVLKYIF